MESRRQSKVARLLQSAFSEVLQARGNEIYGNAMVTVTEVTITPDLGVARINLSIYNTEEKEEVLSMIEMHNGILRKLLGAKIRNNFRRVPELEFYIDDSLDRVFRIEQILKEDKKSKEGSEE